MMPLLSLVEIGDDEIQGEAMGCDDFAFSPLKKIILDFVLV